MFICAWHIIFRCVYIAHPEIEPASYTAQTDWGIIPFDPDMMKDVVGGEKLTYDEYLEIMKASGNKTRQYFELCYYGGVLSNFKGQIEKKSKGMVCFKRIYVSGIYSDGVRLQNTML